MDNSIYEVTRDEYAGFLGQIKKSAIKTETEDFNNFRFFKTYSIKTGTHLCTRVVPFEETETDKENYYVFNMPDVSERQPPKPVQKIILEDKEDVQAFFNIISKITKKKEDENK